VIKKEILIRENLCNPWLPILFAILLSLSLFSSNSFSQGKDWKEDILILLKAVETPGDYQDLVELIEVAPSLQKDPEIRKAFVTFAPKGMSPPEWAREERESTRIEEKGEKIATAETAEKLADAAEEKKEEETRRIAQEVTAQKKEAAPRPVAEAMLVLRSSTATEGGERKRPEIIKEEPKIEAPQEVEIVTEGPPEKIATTKAQKEKERREMEEGIKEELGVIPTPLPEGAKVIHSTDVVSEVKAKMVGGKMRVTITLSGERKYTVCERARPPAIVIDIPHTINTVSPRRIVVNQGCVRTVEVTQYRAVPFDETRVIIRLSRFKEYKVKSKGNEICVEFEE